MLDENQRQARLSGGQPMHPVDARLGDEDRAPDALQPGGVAKRAVEGFVEFVKLSRGRRQRAPRACAAED